MEIQHGDVTTEIDRHCTMADVSVVMLGNNTLTDISLSELYLCSLRYIGENIIIIINIIDKVCVSFQHSPTVRCTTHN